MSIYRIYLYQDPNQYKKVVGRDVRDMKKEIRKNMVGGDLKSWFRNNNKI